MKLLVACSLSAMWLVAAEGQARNAPDKTPPRVVKPVEIPKGAVETEPGTFRFTDAHGKKWIYRKTPFGVARMEDKPVADRAVQAADSSAGVTAVEDGDSIHFERPGPFGAYRWTTRKTELNEMERTVWNREKANAASKKD